MTPAELRKLLDAGTKGPWEFRATEHSGGVKFVVSNTAPRNDNGTEFVTADCSHGCNGRLIATIRNLAPHLLALWEAAESAVHHDGALGLHSLRDALTALQEAKP